MKGTIPLHSRSKGIDSILHPEDKVKRHGMGIEPKRVSLNEIHYVATGQWASARKSVLSKLLSYGQIQISYTITSGVQNVGSSRSTTQFRNFVRLYRGLTDFIQQSYKTAHFYLHNSEGAKLLLT